jgi:hypothetical protein
MSAPSAQRVMSALLQRVHERLHRYALASAQLAPLPLPRRATVAGDPQPRIALGS